MNSYHAIVFRPYESIKNLIEAWGALCKSIAVAEHPAEGRTKRIHCHILMIECDVKPNSLNETKRKLYNDLEGVKNSKIMIETQKEKLPITRQGLVYLLKGDRARLKYEKLFSPAEIEEAVASWVKPTQTEADSRTNPEEKPKNHWEIIEEIRKEYREIYYTKSSERLFTGMMRDDIKISYNTEKLFKILMKKLDKYHIKTSVFDVERWYVTCLRDDSDYQETLYEKVKSKLEKVYN